jgi:hypothetical protein
MRIGYIFLSCDMYKSSLRHMHDPVLSSLKMKGIRLLFFKQHRDLFNIKSFSIFEYVKFWGLFPKGTKSFSTNLKKNEYICSKPLEVN